MAVVVKETPSQLSPAWTTGGGGTGGGSRGDGGGGDGRGGNEGENPDSADLSRLGMWLGLIAVGAFFASLMLIFYLRSRNHSHWSSASLPPLFWGSTLLLVVSSVTFEKARHALRDWQDASYRRWLMITCGLGVGFLGTQLLAWQQLLVKGVRMASDPHGSFFYIAPGLHGLHVFGGLLALFWLTTHAQWRRGGLPEWKRRRSQSGVVALYWHFMDAVWVGLFALLLLWR